LRAVGSSRMSSPLNVMAWRAFWTSTTGETPVTTTDSVKAPTFSVAFTGAVKPLARTMSSNFWLENPCRLKVTV
jgi:hypothetical protein